MLLAVKAPLGSSALTLCGCVKMAFIAVDVVVLTVIGLRKTAGLAYTMICFGIKVHIFLLFGYKILVFNWLL